MIKKSCFKIQIHYFWILKIFFLVWSKQRWKNYWRWIYQSWFVYSRIIWIWRIRRIIRFFGSTKFFFWKKKYLLIFCCAVPRFYSEAILSICFLLPIYFHMCYKIVNRFGDLKKSLCSVITMSINWNYKDFLMLSICILL